MSGRPTIHQSLYRKGNTIWYWDIEKGSRSSVLRSWVWAKKALTGFIGVCSLKHSYCCRCRTGHRHVICQPQHYWITGVHSFIHSYSCETSCQTATKHNEKGSRRNDK